MSKLSIIGAGAWGTTISILAAENGHSPTIWSYEEEVAKSINELRENKKYLDGFQLPQNIDSTTDMKKAAESDITDLGHPFTVLKGHPAENGGVREERCGYRERGKRVTEIETQKRMSESH